MPTDSNGPFVTIGHIARWSEDTWGRQWANSRVLNELAVVANVDKLIEYVSSLRIQRDYLALSDRNVTGHISEGWRDLNVTGPLFQESLWTVMQVWPLDWTPVEYLMKYAVDCKLKYPSQRNYDLGRAVRNLPSFLREYLIHSLLIEHGVPVSVPSPIENAKGHADLFISAIQGVVGLWSFQATKKGYGMLHRKIQFRAASFSEFNFLCPFRSDIDSENINGWYVPKKKYIESIVEFLGRFELSNSEELKSWMMGENENQKFLLVSGEEMQKFRKLN